MTADRFYLGLDQGTQSSRAIVFDQQGNLVTKAQVGISIQSRSNVIAEQNPVEILQSIQNCLTAVYKEVGAENIHSAGLATQRSSVMTWHRQSGEPLSPLISWRDRRAMDFVATLRSRETEIQHLSGLKLTAYYGASKCRWLLQHHKATQLAAKQQCLSMGPLASFLIQQLCQAQPYLIDHANALRMQLLNYSSLTWDEHLCRWFEVPVNLLPPPVATNDHYGELVRSNIPLNAVNGDQTAAMYSLGNIQPDEILINLGTGGFVLSPVPDQTPVPDGLLGGLSRSSHHGVDRLIEGTINGCGAALNWYKKEINHHGSFNLDNCLESFQGELLFMNGVNGLGSPLWHDIPTRFVHRKSMALVETPPVEQAVAAIIESILFLLNLNIEKMRSAVSVKTLRLSGGLANSDQLCQRLANLCELEVIRPDITEATARGVAWLASGLTEHWACGEDTKTFHPVKAKKLQLRYAEFIKILLKTA